MTNGLETLRVLLADDNQHMRDIVSTLLRDVGITKIEAVADGAQALTCVVNWQPDLAIVDFKMEPINGVEFTRQVRTSTASGNTYLPIIMMTGYSARDRIIEARDAGVTELIAKPITAHTLFERVSAVLTRQRPFVRCSTYFGPCRRRRTDGGYMGEERRLAPQPAFLR